MKLENLEKKSVVVGDVISNHDMTVNTSNKLISILIDGLYQDKLGSVIRELSFNAVDAHLAAGNQHEPFNIYIPGDSISIQESELVFEDFGTGLTKAEIIKYFGGLLESTKSDSNKYVGAFGIGCKSPFAISNMYTVESNKDGKKTIVIFSRADNSNPTFTILGEHDTTQRNGTTIRIPCSETDCVNKIKRQLAALEVKPNVYSKDFDGNYVNVEINYPSIYKLSKDLSIIQFNSYNTASAIYINMGQVLYPISYEELEGTYIQRTNHSNSLIINFDIGEISMLPNREQLEHSKSNISKINSKLISSLDDYYKFCIDYIVERCNANTIRGLSNLSEDVHLDKLLSMGAITHNTKTALCLSSKNISVYDIFDQYYTEKFGLERLKKLGYNSVMHARSAEVAKLIPTDQLKLIFKSRFHLSCEALKGSFLCFSNIKYMPSRKSKLVIGSDLPIYQLNHLAGGESNYIIKISKNYFYEYSKIIADLCYLIHEDNVKVQIVEPAVNRVKKIKRDVFNITMRMLDSVSVYDYKSQNFAPLSEAYGIENAKNVYVDCFIKNSKEFIVIHNGDGTRIDQDNISLLKYHNVMLFRISVNKWRNGIRPSLKFGTYYEGVDKFAKKAANNFMQNKEDSVKYIDSTKDIRLAWTNSIVRREIFKSSTPEIISILDEILSSDLDAYNVTSSDYISQLCDKLNLSGDYVRRVNRVCPLPKEYLKEYFKKSFIQDRM